MPYGYIIVVHMKTVMITLHGDSMRKGKGWMDVMGISLYHGTSLD
jgi:hypothetical protein